MREVIPKFVWIGNARDAREITVILNTEIQAVVDLAMEEPGHAYPREIIACRFPLIDGDGNSPALLRTAIQTITSLIENAIPTLVVCSAGMSRSPAITAVALSKAKGDSPDEWLTRIASAGPHDVAPALWNDALETIYPVQ